MAQNRDKNHGISPTRKGDPIGGIIDVDVSALTANTWYRLMPSGSAGAKVTGNRKQINLGTLRADVRGTRFHGWFLRILNPSHQPVVYKVNSITSAGICTLSREPDYYDALPASAIQWVLFPDMDFPMAVTRQSDTTHAVELGIASVDEIAPATTEIRRLFPYRADSRANSVAIRTTDVDRLFYRYTTLGSDDTSLTWGEHIPYTI